MTVTVEEIREIVDHAETMTDMNTLINDLPLMEQDIDSLDMANIVLLIEEKYKITIPNEDMNKIQSIDNIVEYLTTY